MNGLIRKAGLLTLGSLLLASIAVAGVPSSNNSTLTLGIPLGVSTTVSGSPDGVEAQPAHPSLNRTFTIRDGNNVAVPNVVVTIDFTTCTNGQFRLCQTQTAPGVTINCAAKTIQATTNSVGQVTFAAAGGNTRPSAQTVNGPCATVTSLGQTLGTLRLSSFDMDNAGGITGADVGNTLTDRSNYIISPANYVMASDFDGDGDVDGGDVGAMLTLRAAAISNVPPNFVSCVGGVCP